MKIIAIIVGVIAILLLGASLIFIRAADNSDARATAMLTLFPGLFVAAIDAVFWLAVWLLP